MSNAGGGPPVIVLDDSDTGAAGRGRGGGGARPPSSGVMRGSAPRDMPLEQLEKALESTCETLSSLASTVMDFSYDSQNMLFAKVNELVNDLREVDAKGKLVTASVPIEVLEAIDKGRNPDITTSDMLESCAEASSSAQGKLSAMRSFRDELNKCLQENGMPDIAKVVVDQPSATAVVNTAGSAAGAAASATAAATSAAGAPATATVAAGAAAAAMEVDVDAGGVASRPTSGF